MEKIVYANKLCMIGRCQLAEVEVSEKVEKFVYLRGLNLIRGLRSDVAMTGNKMAHQTSQLQ